MGLMTLADYREELTHLLKGRTDSAVTNTRLDRAVNQAYSHLCQPETRRHKELANGRYDVALVAAQVDYPLTSAVVGEEVLGVRDITYYEAAAITPTTTRSDVHPKSVNWMNKRTAPSGGRPVAYALDGTNLVIYPVPSAVEAGNLLRITHWQEPTVLTAIGDVTVLGNYWDLVLLRGAQARLEYDVGLRELSVLTEQKYVALINEKSDDYELNADDDSFGVEFRNEPTM